MILLRSSPLYQIPTGRDRSLSGFRRKGDGGGSENQEFLKAEEFLVFNYNFFEIKFPHSLRGGELSLSLQYCHLFIGSVPKHVHPLHKTTGVKKTNYSGLLNLFAIRTDKYDGGHASNLKGLPELL